MNNIITTSMHTAGPWIPDTVLPRQSQSDRDPILVAFITTREDEDGAVKSVAAAYGATKAECEANARLIAAAPDLLAALDELLAQTVEWIWPMASS